jgi:hypothetical protein
MDFTERKVCTECGLPKPPTDFFPRKNRPTDRSSQCKECNRKQVRERLARIYGTPGAPRADLHERQFQLFAKSCTDCGWIKPASEFKTAAYPYCSSCAALRKEQMRRATAHRIRQRRKARYLGLSVPDRLVLEEKLWEIQNGACAICGIDLSGRKRHLDHDHATGKARGFLCPPCNTGVGHFRDSVALLETARRYLTAYREVE